MSSAVAVGTRFLHNLDLHLSYSKDAKSQPNLHSRYFCPVLPKNRHMSAYLCKKKDMLLLIRIVQHPDPAYHPVPLFTSSFAHTMSWPWPDTDVAKRDILLVIRTRQCYFSQSYISSQAWTNNSPTMLPLWKGEGDAGRPIRNAHLCNQCGSGDFERVHMGAVFHCVMCGNHHTHVISYYVKVIFQDVFLIV